ncbi:MAG TPA: hypothetical protein PKN32_04890 [Bacteroidales bacterium]|nr:hypothetical protein [Bacteroidales bacterium]
MRFGKIKIIARKVLMISGFVLIFVNILQSQEKTLYKYLFLGHTYMSPTEIDRRLTYLNKSVYNNIWLGGDICSETLLYYSNLDYLNEKLKIKQAHNYWSLGNHDRRNGNIEWLEKYLGHKSYYADYYNGFTAFVFDTNLDISDCENLNKQYELFCNVTDTISESSHLLLFFHWGLWYNVPGLPIDPLTYANSGLKYWNANCDSVNTNFVNIIYPKLVEVKERGVEVICVMGDMGKSYKKADMLSTEGIHFLGCGLDNIYYQWWPQIYNTCEKDLVLIFEHDIEQKTITWRFRDLDSLLDVQNGYKYLTKLTFDDFENYPEENIQFIENENYMYKLMAFDSLVLVNVDSGQFVTDMDTINFRGVCKSESETDATNLYLISLIYNNSNLVETDSISLNQITPTIKFFQDTISFDNNMSNCNKLIIYIKSETDEDVLLNDFILKYKTSE